MNFYIPNTLTIEQAKKRLIDELAKGYDPIRIAEVASHFFNDFDRDIPNDALFKIQDKLLVLMAMDMGPEFYRSEDEVRNLIESFDEI